MVEADLKPYDYMALVPVIQVGAGCWRALGAGGCWAQLLLLLLCREWAAPCLPRAFVHLLRRCWVQGAGGIITDWRGQPLRWPADGQGDVSACSGEVVAAGDAAAHRQAVELLAWK